MQKLALASKLAIVLLSWLVIARGVSAEEVSLSPPSVACSFHHLHATFQRVRELDSPADFQFRSRPGLSPDLSYTFPPGTVVTVNQQHMGWSCVAGSKQTSAGWTTYSGWLRSSRLRGLE